MTALYPVGRLRGMRITRLEEQPIGPFCLDAPTAAELGTENIGVLFGNCIDLERTIRRLRPLDAAPEQASWVVVAATREMAASVFKIWHYPEEEKFIDAAVVPPRWRAKRFLFTTPEALRDLDPAQIDGPSIAGLLLLDLQFLVHKARAFDTRSFRVRRKKAVAEDDDHSFDAKPFRVHHDRPQFIADFRGRCAREGWSPPLVIFAGSPAKSLNTDAALSAYGLEALWFIDGSTFGCWEASDD
jgi:hypothetical protein